MYAKVYETADRELHLFIYDENKEIVDDCYVKTKSQARKIAAKYNAECRF